MTPNAVGVGHGVRARGEPGWVLDEHLRVHPFASPGEGGGGQRMAGALLNARLARVEHARRCGRLPRNHRLVPGFRGSSSRLTTLLPAWSLRLRACLTMEASIVLSRARKAADGEKRSRAS